MGLGFSGCQNGDAPAVHADMTKTPTEILKNFEMNDTKNGEKTTTLIATEARIYEAQNYADVDQPLLYFYKAGKESSRLKAPQGRVQTETHEVECWGGVTVVSADSSTLTTERLRYDPKVQKIFSNDAVHLEKPDSITDGIGLETDPELKVVKIGHQTAHMRKGMTQ